MTKEEKEYAVALFHEGKNTVEIGKILERNDSTIGDLLKKNGLQAKENSKKCSNLQIQEICQLYVGDELSTPTIGDMYNISERTVASYLSENDIKLRSGGIISKITNIDYFTNIDNQTKAYLLGFIIADGGIIVDKRDGRSNGLSMTLQDSDTYILNLLSKELGGNGQDNVYYDGKNQHSSFRVYNQEIVDSLTQYGVVPRKTHISYLPLVEPKLMRHMIRGIFDGDGTVFFLKGSSKRPYLRFGFYGTPLIIQQIKSYLMQVINISDLKITHKDGVSFITWGKPVDVKNFYNLIYTDAEDLLTRKKEKFDKFFTFL